MDGVPRVPEQWRPEESAALRFGVLGPVRAWHGEKALSTGSPQQRALLAALLLREGRTATAGELIDALWGDEPPSQALAAVRTYASRLRKVLPAGVMVSESGGYAIRGLPEEALDVSLAQALAADAEKAKAAGDLCRARALLNEALALWDGEPLASLPGPYAETQRARLDEWRLQLLESRLDMDLEQGCHAEAVSELTALTAAHPLRERLRELLMLALYRSGRQAEALAVYADTRHLLAEELGVDPRSGLKELQQRILQADPGLAEPSGPAAEPPPAPVRPAQLPATVPDFTGRDAFVAELSDVLASAEGRVMAVSALAGIGGVGKTTLAVHVAHQARAAFPDGQLYVDLQGAGQRAAEPETVLGAFLRALGTADSAIPDSLEERSALYRSVLDGRRVLVLLDNARDAAQVRPLLPGMEGCAALVTSRVRMVGLAGAHLVDLDVMSPEEALQLFTKIVGEERVASEREAALDVVAACGFLPLAIRIAASRLAARRTWTVSVLAAKLADERRRLDELQAGDLAVKATFELGYGQLDPPQARAFRLLGLADGPDMSLAAAAAVLDLPAEETEDLLESLVDTSLLESAAPGRYRYHDLVRLYARACAERDEHPPSERDAAMARLLDFYLATAAEVFAIERPGDRLVDHLEQTRTPGLVFPDRRAAQDWLYSEAVPLLACVRQSSGGATLRRAVDLLWAAVDLAESGANAKEYEAAATALRDAARVASDRRAEGGPSSSWPTHATGPACSTRPIRRHGRRSRSPRRPRIRCPAAGRRTSWAPSRSTRAATRRPRSTWSGPSGSSAPAGTAPARRPPCAISPGCTWRRIAPTAPSISPSRAPRCTRSSGIPSRSPTAATRWGWPSARAAGRPTPPIVSGGAPGLPREPSAVVGGDDPLPAGRGRSPGPAPGAGGGQLRDGAGVAAGDRRRVASRQRAHGARQVPERDRPARQGSGLLARGPRNLRETELSRGRRGAGTAGSGRRCLTPGRAFIVRLSRPGTLLVVDPSRRGQTDRR